jgi:hypothetical protein
MHASDLCTAGGSASMPVQYCEEVAFDKFHQEAKLFTKAAFGPVVASSTVNSQPACQPFALVSGIAYLLSLQIILSLAWVSNTGAPFPVN